MQYMQSFIFTFSLVIPLTTLWVCWWSGAVLEMLIWVPHSLDHRAKRPAVRCSCALLLATSHSHHHRHHRLQQLQQHLQLFFKKKGFEQKWNDKNNEMFSEIWGKHLRLFIVFCVQRMKWFLSHSHRERDLLIKWWNVNESPSVGSDEETLIKRKKNLKHKKKKKVLK